MVLILLIIIIKKLTPLYEIAVFKVTNHEHVLLDFPIEYSASPSLLSFCNKTRKIFSFCRRNIFDVKIRNWGGERLVSPSPPRHQGSQKIPVCVIFTKSRKFIIYSNFEIVPIFIWKSGVGYRKIDEIINILRYLLFCFDTRKTREETWKAPALY